MGIACVLGLTACISVGGSSYPTDDLFDIIYECDIARSYGYYSDASYILVDGKFRVGMQNGYVALEILEDLGVNFRWKPKGKTPPQIHLARYRKNQMKLACAPFLAYRG